MHGLNQRVKSSKEEKQENYVEKEAILCHGKLKIVRHSPRRLVTQIFGSTS